MTKCRECGGYEQPGALFCSECGAFLLPTKEDEAGAKLPFTDALTPPSVPILIGQEANPATEAQEITFLIPSSGRRIEMDLDQEIQIGRADPGAQHYPELDLTEDEGGTHGVSRLHALIRRSDEGIVLVDESSTNGTLLNGYRLPPDLPYPVHSGDEVRFGRLLVHIFLD